MYPLVLVAVVPSPGMDIDAAYVVVGRTTRRFACLCIDMGHPIYRRKLMTRDRHAFVRRKAPAYMSKVRGESIQRMAQLSPSAVWTKPSM